MARTKGAVNLKVVCRECGARCRVYKTDLPIRYLRCTNEACGHKFVCYEKNS